MFALVLESNFSPWVWQYDELFTGICFFFLFMELFLNYALVTQIHNNKKTLAIELFSICRQSLVFFLLQIVSSFHVANMIDLPLEG